MGIDAQRSGASELRDRAVEVRRGRTAYADRVVVLALRGTQGANSGPGNWQRKSTQAPSTTKAIPVWIVPSAGARVREAEQRLYRPHSGPCNLCPTDDGRAQHSGPCNLRHADDGRAQQDPCALRVAAEPGPRYRASGAAAARPEGRLAQSPLPPEAAYVGLGHRCGGSTMCTDIACAAAPCIRPPGARNAAICTFTTDCQASG